MTEQSATKLGRRGFLAGAGALASGVSVPSASAAEQNTRTETPDDIESTVETVVEETLEEHEIPGAAVAVVDGGEATLVDGFGLAERDTEREATARTPFRVGSVAKPVVLTAVAQLLAAERLDPDVPVSEYVGEDLRSWDEPVTLAHLATHTAGFESTNRGMWYADPAGVPRLSEQLRRAMPAQVRSPGAVGSYSNHGVALAGEVLASTVGTTFPEAMERVLLDPAGMDESSFRQPLPDRIHRAHATGHDGDVDGKVAGLGIAPAGALSASAADMATFMQLHLNDGVVDGQAVLDPAAIELSQRQWFTHHDRLSGMAFGFVEDSRNGVRVLRHNGGTPTFHSSLALVPELDFGLFVSFNSDNAESAREEVREAVLDELFSEPDPETPSPDGRPSRADELTGTYRSLRVPTTTHDRIIGTLTAQTVDVSVADDGALRVNASESDRWVELEPLVFVNERTGDKLAFGERDGEIVHLFFGGSPTAFGSIEWYESNLFYGATSLTVLAGVFSGTRWELSRGENESRREWLTRGRSEPERLAHLSVYLGCTAFLLFAFLTFLYLGYQPLSFLTGPSPLYRVAFVFPLIGLAASVAGIGWLPRVWTDGYWSRRRRVHYTLLVGALSAMGPLLRFWNLLLPS